MLDFARAAHGKIPGRTQTQQHPFVKPKVNEK